MHAALISLTVCVICSMLTGYTYNFGFSEDSCTLCHPLLGSHGQIAQYFENKPFALHPSTIMSHT